MQRLWSGFIWTYSFNMIFKFIVILFPVSNLLGVEGLVPIWVNVHDYFILPLLGDMLHLFVKQREWLQTNIFKFRCFHSTETSLTYVWIKTRHKIINLKDLLRHNTYPIVNPFFFFFLWGMVDFQHFFWRF